MAPLGGNSSIPHMDIFFKFFFKACIWVFVKEQTEWSYIFTMFDKPSLVTTVVVFIFKGKKNQKQDDYVRYKNKGKRAVMDISTAIKITYLAREPHRFLYLQ